MINDNTTHGANYVLIAIKYDTITGTVVQFINKSVHTLFFLQFRYHFKQHFLISHIKLIALISFKCNQSQSNINKLIT